MRIAVEVAAHTIESALAAEAGGATRVELFSNPREGGVTPSAGMIAVTRTRIRIPLHVLVRPRGGDFVYDGNEFEAMLRDIALLKRLGADGVVFGLIKADGTIDSPRTEELVKAARPMSVTFHRAFDVCRDLDQALADAVACGVDRVLTSGASASALAGAPVLQRLVKQAGTRVIVVAAGGVRPSNAKQIVEATGVSEVHAGLRSIVPGPMEFQNPKISFGSGASEYERLVVQENDVRELMAAVEGLA